MVNQDIFTVKISGAAGQGIKSIGLILAKVATRSGYYVYNYIEYPSLIRGGHNVMCINISKREVLATKKTADLEVDLLHESNVVAVGKVVQQLGGDFELYKKLIIEEYGEIKEEIPVVKKTSDVLKPLENISPKMIVNANDAVALGAICAGLQFASIYPMSPASGILHTLAKYQNDYGYIYKQPEDEICAINMAIGAAFAGSRAMTATSGGGFCLMTEGYGLAGMSETPLVIVNAMRGGPATGMPTWSEQGDLEFVLHAGQGDFPKIVLAPGDAKEAFELTRTAFNLADKYQTPVVILIDKNLCDNDQSFSLFDQKDFIFDRGKFSTDKIADYKRYLLSDDGVSLRTIPGTGNQILGTSYEHEESGLASEEISDRIAQMDKRMKKIQTCVANDMPKPILYGPENTTTTIVSWGSNKGAILEAIKDNSDVNYLHLTWISPFPTETVKEILGKAKKIVNIECNQAGQMKNLIKEKTGIEITNNLLKYDGRPIFSEEIELSLRGV